MGLICKPPSRALVDAFIRIGRRDLALEYLDAHRARLVRHTGQQSTRIKGMSWALLIAGVAAVLGLMTMVGCGTMHVTRPDYSFTAHTLGKVKAESCRVVRCPSAPMSSENDQIITACDRLDGGEVSDVAAGIFGTLGTIGMGFATGAIKF